MNNYDIFFRKSPASLVRKTAEWFDTQVGARSASIDNLLSSNILNGARVLLG